MTCLFANCIKSEMEYIGIMIFLVASANRVFGTLTETPQNTVILQYTRLRLNCSSDLSTSTQFQWGKKRQDDSYELLGSSCSAPSGDYELIASDPNSCDLVVSNATTDHAGIYRCRTLSDQYVYAAVTVLDGDPIITSAGDLKNVTVGQNVSLSCSLSYSGDMEALVNWIVPPNVTILSESISVVTQAVANTNVLLTSYEEGQYNISLNISFTASSINIIDLDSSIAAYESFQKYEISFFLPAAEIILFNEPLPDWAIALIVVLPVLSAGFVIYACCRYHKDELIFPCCECCKCCDCWNRFLVILCCAKGHSRRRCGKGESSTEHSDDGSHKTEPNKAKVGY